MPSMDLLSLRMTISQSVPPKYHYVIASAFHCYRATSKNNQPYEEVKFEVVVILFFHDVAFTQ